MELLSNTEHGYQFSTMPLVDRVKSNLRTQHTANFMWHPQFQVTDIVWLELETKTQNTYRSRVNFYHSLGSFWSVECGLFSTEEDVQKCIATYLFSSLHHMTDNNDFKDS
eukprot:scaffold37156_cov43-Cyclotella_meneghiniana.AAC.2